MLAAARHELEAAQAEVAAARASIARREAERAGALQRRDDLTARVASVAAEETAAGERLEALVGEERRLRDEIDGLAARVDGARGRAAEDEARLTVAARRASRGELELETLREEAHRRRSRLASLTEIQDRYERFQKGVRAIMQEHRATGGGIDGIKGVVADIVQPPPELETAVEAVLGERLGNVIVDSHEAGVEAIQFLKRTREGRSSFIPRALRAHGSRGQVVYDATSGTAAASMPETSSRAGSSRRSTTTRSPPPGRRGTACAGRCSS